MIDRINTIRDALKRLLNRDQQNTCQHENTHRGGAIWEICNDCGASWADDRGGKPEWKDPPAWAAAEEATEALAELEAAMQEQATLIVRGCCEAEKADPGHPDTICISVQDLTGIVECYAAPPAQQVQAEAVPHIPLTVAEVQSGHDRVRWAEGLIRQLPEDHDGRNSWLLNYGSDRAERQAEWAKRTGRDSPAPKMAEAVPQEYTGPRCMCVLTGCRAGSGCPHYNDNCKAHIAHQQAEPPWVQCTTRNNDCLGGCRSRAEHERYNKGTAAAQQKGGV